MANQGFHEQQDIKNAKRLRELISELPDFVFEFFRGIEPTTSSRTRIAYAYDLRVFFNYLKDNHPDFIDFKSTSLKALKIDSLELVRAIDLEMYLDYLSVYTQDPSVVHAREYANKERGKSRKLACLKTFYNYFYKKEKIKNNPTVFVDMPKIHDKHIIRLEIDEVARLLDEVESGNGLTMSQQNFHEHTKERDLALLTLLLGTGIRVSECVGLNVKDVDFNKNGIRIIRKGGTEVIVYFGDEVRQALQLYLELRKKILAHTGHEDALFLSLQKKRLSVRAIQNLVKKYAQLVTHLKHISPHKLRSTFGTSLYRETGDIYLVADVLGHKDVNTTKKHYAEIADERRRQAAKSVRLREDSK